MSQELANVESGGLLTVIERIAANPDVDVSKLEKMLDMQERVLTRNAMVAFSKSLAEMQSEIPTIEKGGSIIVSGVERSKYARFEDIMAVVRPILEKHGFAVSFRTDSTDSLMRVTGILMHREGHREETTLTLPFDISGSKNSVQAIGSSTAYGKRYVLCSLLNIATGGEDDDGQAASIGAELAETLVSLSKAETIEGLQATYLAAIDSFKGKHPQQKIKEAARERKQELQKGAA